MIGAGAPPAGQVGLSEPPVAPGRPSPLKVGGRREGRGGGQSPGGRRSRPPGTGSTDGSRSNR